MKDKVLKCKNCNQEFAFTADEQQYFIKKGLEEPVNCPICRATFKAARQDKFRGKVNK